ncbi:hypothetical protein GCM10022280_19340 [Sphingomonas swuensis]|uniref:TonB C-terminal domain-containing protein n=1 Tax=Sphingomonas swuensis TaxID=977800 RepID=A0ABP7T193_9SPHN
MTGAWKIAAGAAAGAMLAGLAPPTAPEEPNLAKPTSGWQVDFGEQRCVAMREYALGERKVLVALEPDPANDGARLLFRVPLAASAKPVFGWSEAKVTADGKAISKFVSSAPSAKEGQLFVAGWSADTLPSAPPLATLGEVGIESKALTGRFPLTGMAKIDVLLRECNRGLLESWGMSKAVQAEVTRWPTLKVPAGRLFNYTDYPTVAMILRQQGDVRTRLSINEKGRVTDCKIRYSSGFDLLDSATCRGLIQRGRYEPALGKDGKPMPALAFQSVRWVMPD